MLYEIDARMRVDENGIIIAAGEDEVWMARLDEWLRTPEGSVYGLPRWGNPMAEFKHEPIGSLASGVIEVAIEARLRNKLNEDLPGLGIEYIQCTSQGVDLLKISFNRRGTSYTVSFLKGQD